MFVWYHLFKLGEGVYSYLALRIILEIHVQFLRCVVFFANKFFSEIISYYIATIEIVILSCGAYCINVAYLLCYMFVTTLYLQETNKLYFIY